MTRSISALLLAAFLLFLLSLILPNEFFQRLNAGARPFRTFLASATLLLAAFRAYLIIRSGNRSHPILPVLLFFGLFVWFLNSHYRNIDYQFGADDAFYYAYLTSIFVDGDLDFENQYATTGMEKIMEPQFYDQRTAAGVLPNVYPAGTPLFWIPFFLAGQALSSILASAGFSVPLNGYSNVCLTTVLIGNCALLFSGLYLTFLAATRMFTKWIALAATILLWLTTPAFFHSFPLLVSEPASLFTVSLIFYLSHRSTSIRTILIAGILTGLSTAVRPYNFIFGLVPLFFLLRSAPERKKLFIGGTLLAGGFILGFMPQIVIWRIMHHQWFVNLSGSYLPYLDHPFVIETLFSARNGLFVWSPVLLLSAAGLFLMIRRDRAYALLLWFLFLFCLYLNAATVDWWGSTSFGGRRFLNCFVIFTIALSAVALSKLQQSRLRVAIVFTICLALVPLNLHLSRKYRRGYLPHGHAPVFSSTLEGVFDFYEPLLRAIQYPVKVLYGIKYDIQTPYDTFQVFAGEDILYFQEVQGNLLEKQDNPLFGPDWSAPQKTEDGIIRRVNHSSSMNLPLFFKAPIPLMMEIAIHPETPGRLIVEFYLNGEKLARRPIGMRAAPIRLPIPARKYRMEMNELQIRASWKDQQPNPPVLIVSSLRFYRAARKQSD